MFKSNLNIKNLNVYFNKKFKMILFGKIFEANKNIYRNSYMRGC